MGKKRFFNKVFDGVLGGFASLSGILLVYVMFSVTLDVVLRYFFNRPQFWVGELAEYSLLYITFAGTAWVLKRDSHVKIDILNTILSPRHVCILNFISNIIGVFVCSVLTYYGTKVTWDHFERGMYNPTLMEFPKGPLLLIIPVGTFLLLIEFIRRTLKNFEELRTR